MTLHDVIQSDSVAVFCNQNDFAEPVKYHKRNGPARAIKAVVVRDEIALYNEDGVTISPVFEVHVANNSTSGISSEEIDLGGDWLSFESRVGKVAARHSITRLISHDEGMLQLECR